MSATFPTTIGEPRYQLNTPFESLKSVSVYNTTTERWQIIDVMDTRLYDAQYKPATDQRGIPTHYFRENTSIILWPTPDAVDDIKIRYRMTLADLAAGNAEPDVPQVWHEIILFGAIWRCFARLGDMARKDSYKADWLGMLNNTTPVVEKEKVDTKFAGVVLLRRNYGVYSRGTRPRN
jgi:hypothetical protein